MYYFIIIFQQLKEHTAKYIVGSTTPKSYERSNDPSGFVKCGTFLGYLRTYLWVGLRSQYSDWLRAGRSGDRIPMGRDFPHLSRPASCTTGTGSFPGVKSGRDVTLTRHSLLVPWSWKSKAIPLRAVQPVQSLSACTRVHFTFTFWGLTCFSRMTLPHGVS
jgi:hypothetical protein